MTAEELLSRTAQGAFVAIWIAVLAQAIRRPRPATIHAAIFFGLAAILVFNRWASDLGVVLPEAVERGIVVPVAALSLVLLLLADDFAGVPRKVLVGSGALFVAIAVSLYVAPRPLPVAHVLALIAYVNITLAYAAWRFIRSGIRSPGVTGARVRAVAFASAMLGVVFAFAGLRVAFPAGEATWSSLISLASSVSATAYYVAFLPPRFLRRAWQAPQLERFFAASTLVPRESLADLTRTLEEQVASMLGRGQDASIALWDERRQALIWPAFEGNVPEPMDLESTIAYRSFRSQRAMLVERADEVDPVNAEVYRRFGAQAITAAPITNGDRRLGLLMAFGQRAPLFAEDELDVVRIIARQVGILLRDYQLTEELTAFRGHQEAARLKDDFLAAAAHDLRTPLTTLVAQSQLMQRRALRDPDAPADVQGITRIVQETTRMRRVVDDLLDAARGDQVGFVGQVQTVDLVALITEVVGAIQGRTVNFTATPVSVEGDEERIRQVMTNLCENAVKYSPQGGDIDVTLTTDADFAVVVVKDRGIGISGDDAKIIFERFRRAPGVRHGSMTGLGLGLYFCKRIIEDHGGRIALRSTPGEGSEFEVRLPMSRALPVAAHPETSEAPALQVTPSMQQATT